MEKRELRMAIPKGRIQEGLISLLKRSGITLSFVNDRDYSPSTNVDYLKAKMIKARAIPQLIALGNFQLGFSGQDLIKEYDYENTLEILNLNLNTVEIIVATSKDMEDILINPPTRPIVIATEYENLATRWALQKGLSHIIIQTWGSTESYAPEDADIVFDNMETGNTLRANGLIVIDKIMTSSTCLVVNKNVYENCTDSRNKINQLFNQLKKFI